jgi:hypothetical protein
MNGDQLEERRTEGYLELQKQRVVRFWKMKLVKDDR